MRSRVALAFIAVLLVRPTEAGAQPPADDAPAADEADAPLGDLDLVAADATPAIAQTRAHVGSALYVDSQDTVIWSPSASAGARLFGVWEVDASWEADIITSASVDVVTAATPSISEVRQEVDFAVSREGLLADLDVAASYGYSFENDSDSHLLSLSLSRGFFEDTLELGLQYAFNFNRTGLESEPASNRERFRNHGLELSFVLTADSRTLIEGIYSFMRADGFLASPYRRVPYQVGGTFTSLVGASWVSEAVPDSRTRHAVLLRGRRAFSDLLLGSLSYRFHIDDWGVMTHTEELSLGFQFSEDVTLAVRQRLSIDSAASFYKQRYRAPLRYMTRDRRLSDHFSALAGLTLSWELGPVGTVESVDLHLSVDGVVWRYNDFFEPVLTPTGGAGVQTLGWIVGGVAQVSLELRP